MKNEIPQFAFEKKLGISECMHGDIPFIQMIIGKLLICMQETNKKYGLHCEFFRLDFRQPYSDENDSFPFGSLILELKWGCKAEVENKKRIMK